MRYLLDTNVLKELSRPKPHQNVEVWFDTVDDNDLAISVISVREISKGIEKKRQSDELTANTLAKAADGIFSAFAGRILPVDETVARCWGRALGQSDKHVDDAGLAATAEVHNLIMVTRNVSDFDGRGVAVLDPFKKSPRPVPPKT
ncbi:type II toxin-antitoxin system VapC family toxin [Rhizobium sp. CNPSo 3490]|uniref:type II toxin-antitoxin system VapC family toxin n=1 Tax=Rhizobium sp. CNPSo 3490 TaxID=3021407 RepID=UPI002550C8E5|nr:type II toxin-antitoxin system VapC family toxin [Rhizobium sp. CNPSo 3490]MDK4731495.1 type II toxin-antitoxin system VapC family toxin [Rhizobium sp. CNPSo 3490]